MKCLKRGDPASSGVSIVVGTRTAVPPQAVQSQEMRVAGVSVPVWGLVIVVNKVSSLGAVPTAWLRLHRQRKPRWCDPHHTP